MAAKKAAPVEARPLTVRSRDLLKAPPGLLGFSHLITPDEAFGQVKFKANVHYGDKPLASLKAILNEGYFELMQEMADLATERKTKVKLLTKLEVYAWLDEKTKQPREGDSLQEPHLQFDCNASYRNKDGEEVPITVKAWDPHGAPVDLKGLRLGMGSIVKPFFTIGLWAGPLSKGVALPKLRLVGLQVLKLKQFGGNAGHSSVGEVSDADLAFLDENFAADDLSQFLQAKPEGKTKATNPTDPDMEDELPF